MRALEAELAEYRRGWPPGHFYSPIPALDEVKRREQELFGPSPAQLPGHRPRRRRPARAARRVRRADRRPTVVRRAVGGRPVLLRQPELPARRGARAARDPARSRARAVLEVGSGYSSAAILDVASGSSTGRRAPSWSPTPSSCARSCAPRTTSRCSLVRSRRCPSSGSSASPTATCCSSTRRTSPRRAATSTTSCTRCSRASRRASSSTSTTSTTRSSTRASGCSRGGPGTRLRRAGVPRVQRGLRGPALPVLPGAAPPARAPGACR